MSVKAMAEVWDLDLPRSEKFVLLAYVDHADHNGKNIFPAVATIMKKTGYEERSVQSITRALEKRGLLVPDGKGPKGTNRWRYPIGEGANFAGVQKEAQKGCKKQRKGVQPTAPEPSLTDKKEPSLKEGAKAQPLKANQIPQIVLFREVVRRYPSKGSQFTVITSMDKIGDRLRRDVSAQDLEPYYREWCDRGYNPTSVKWLSEWAVSGKIPQNGKPTAIPQGVTAAQSWLQKRQAQSG